MCSAKIGAKQYVQKGKTRAANALNEKSIRLEHVTWCLCVHMRTCVCECVCACGHVCVRGSIWRASLGVCVPACVCTCVCSACVNEKQMYGALQNLR